MYCVYCGVKLADTEKICPLCGTTVFHPDLIRGEGEHLYPPDRSPVYHPKSYAVLIVITTLFLLPMLITLLCDWQITHSVTWSGYVVGALFVAYVLFILPSWFRKPNPVIFIPCSFAAIALYLWCINWETGGSWFLSLGLPVVGGLCLIATTIAALFRYLKRGRLYVVGGAAIALGLFMPVMEYLIYLTFQMPKFAIWSFYPLIPLVLLGGMLIFLAICRPAREVMERKFFL